MTEADVRKMLESECAKIGGRTAWAKKHRISQTYVQLVCKGRQQAPGPAILKALGLRKLVSYETIGRRG